MTGVLTASTFTPKRYERTYRYIITNHARERFVERFSQENGKLYAHLGECLDKTCPRCVSLVFKLKREVEENRRYIDKVICAKLHEAKETRIHHNNIAFMDMIQRRYGDKRFHFLVHNDILFVVIDAPEGQVLVTCLDARNSVIGGYVRRPKYRKKEAVVA